MRKSSSQQLCRPIGADDHVAGKQLEADHGAGHNRTGVLRRSGIAGREALLRLEAKTMKLGGEGFECA